MRTTISLPEDLHAQLSSLSRDRRETLSRTIEELIRRALRSEKPAYVMHRHPETGLLGIDFGEPITEEDVRSLDDDE